MIHPTAIIAKNAKVEAGASIGAYSVIEDKAVIGKDCVIGPHVTIGAYTRIGPNCRIHPYAAVGLEPQDLKFKGEESWVTIGARTAVREFATINRGTAAGGGLTAVGEDNFLMAYSHVAHDCKTGRGVILANNATLAGHIEIDDYAFIGGLVAIHQFVRIGKYAYIGGKSAVVKDIPPYVMASGDRARLHGLNKVGLKRHGFDNVVLDALKQTYRILFRVGLTRNEALERIRAQADKLPEVTEFMNFMQSSKRGVTR